MSGIESTRRYGGNGIHQAAGSSQPRGSLHPLSTLFLMSDRPSVLATNDDGIDSTGLHVLVDALQSVADVTVVAPIEDQSGTGRTNSYRVAVDEYEHGFAVDGKPADCVAVGLRGLDVDVDLVVSGINPGPNIGWQTVGRSGTVGAAAEAAFLGVPAMAVSLYDPEVGIREFEREEFEPAGDLAADLLPAIREGVPGGDYLNVVAPAGGGPAVATDPSGGYDVRAIWDGDYVDFENALYDPILPGSSTDPEPGTDIEACSKGQTSVSTLRVQSTGGDRGALAEALEAALAGEQQT